MVKVYPLDYLCLKQHFSAFYMSVACSNTLFWVHSAGLYLYVITLCKKHLNFHRLETYSGSLPFILSPFLHCFEMLRYFTSLMTLLAIPRTSVHMFTLSHIDEVIKFHYDVTILVYFPTIAFRCYTIFWSVANREILVHCILNMNSVHVMCRQVITLNI